jgi:transposase InsO family protein
MTRYNILSVS